MQQGSWANLSQWEGRGLSLVSTGLFWLSSKQAAQLFKLLQYWWFPNPIDIFISVRQLQRKPKNIYGYFRIGHPSKSLARGDNYKFEYSVMHWKFPSRRPVVHVNRLKNSNGENCHNQSGDLDRVKISKQISSHLNWVEVIKLPLLITIVYIIHVLTTYYTLLLVYPIYSKTNPWMLCQAYLLSVQAAQVISHCFNLHIHKPLWKI